MKLKQISTSKKHKHKERHNQIPTWTSTMAEIKNSGIKLKKKDKKSK